MTGYEDVNDAGRENFAGLARKNRKLVGKAEAVDSPQWVALNVDSKEIPVHGGAGAQRPQRSL